MRATFLRERWTRGRRDGKRTPDHARDDQAEGSERPSIETARRDVAAYYADRSTLAALPLGRFSDASVRSLLARRLLLHLPLLTLQAGARLLATRGGRAADWMAEVIYWRTAKARLARDEWAALTHGPVILMYHAVARPGEPTSRYVIPKTAFERQMHWLRMRRHPLLTLRELASLLTERKLPAANSVVVTFDDGYEDNFAALRDAGIPATVFVVTGSIGAENGWDAGGALRGRKMLSWEEARQLAAAGVEVSAHAATHPALTEIPDERVAEELARSLEDLRQELGPGVYTFAYPHGRQDARVQAAVAAAGFAAAAGSQGGVNDPYIPRHALRRVEIKGTDSFASFVLMVALGRRITPGRLLRSLFVG